MLHESQQNLFLSRWEPLLRQDFAANIQGLFDELKRTFSEFYWIGIYWLRDGELHVGPYAGPKTDHTRIKVGQGVCGTAVAENKNQIVHDVRALTNYLACNLETRAEIVVLMRDASGRVIGQIDADGTKIGGFDHPSYEQFLTKLAQLIATHKAA